MQETLLRALRSRRPAIRSRWETLLRIEPVNSALANPDTLVYLFDQTLAEIFTALRQPYVPSTNGCSLPEPHGCGKNPLVCYFVAAEQAVLEALILAQAEMPALDPGQRDADFAQLKLVVLSIAERELAALDQVCQQRPSYAGMDI